MSVALGQNYIFWPAGPKLKKMGGPGGGSMGGGEILIFEIKRREVVE